jgi:ribonuclease-3
VGAIFLDQGYEAARGFISRTVFPLTDKVVSDKLWLDAKSHFQEKAQEIEGTTPSYQVMKEEGPDHDKHFTVAVYIGRDLIAKGDGKSKQEAEQSAARAGLKARAWL